MCELIYVALGHRMMNFAALHLLAAQAAKINDDGFGVYSPNGRLIKTAVSADKLLNMGNVLRDSTPDNMPLMAHVRWASPNIPVTDSNAHPFEGDRFVLAHNGRLYGKDENVTSAQASRDDNQSLSSDSQVFLAKLEERAKLFPTISFHDLITATMGGFKGKFAFLIYDKRDKKYYAVRGKTADLHISFLYPGYEPEKDVAEPPPEENLGFIVMTKASDLDEAGFAFTTLAQTLMGKTIHLTKPILLKEETVFELKKHGAVEVGPITENPTYQYAPVTYHRGKEATSTNYPTTSGDGRFDLLVKHPKYKKLVRIAEFLEENFLTAHDLDEIFYAALGYGISDAEDDDIEYFVTHLIPVLSGQQKLRKIIDKAGISYFPHAMLMRKFPDLQFPWTLTESPKVVIDAIRYWEETRKSK